jgi:hypothetical protein
MASTNRKDPILQKTKKYLNVMKDDDYQGWGKYFFSKIQNTKYKILFVNAKIQNTK